VPGEQDQREGCLEDDGDHERRGRRVGVVAAKDDLERPADGSDDDERVKPVALE
jgi:hypothetical protein